MRTLSSVIAMTLVCGMSSVYASVTSRTDSCALDKILVTRITTASSDGIGIVSGVGLAQFNGMNRSAEQLTVLQSGHFYLPGAESDIDITGLQYSSPPWLARNYSPSGERLLYFSSRAVVPTDQRFSVGKYYVMDSMRVSRALFPGTNDLAAPGYGYLTWQPGGDEIAYANSAVDQPAGTQACVELVHSDGRDAHPLWCAPASYTGPQYISAIEWAGNGKSLIAYVNWTVSSNPATDLYQINVSTGAARLVATGIADPGSYRGTADVSYDGSKVIYEQFGGDQPAEDCHPAVNFGGPEATLCLTDMKTGQTSIVPETTVGAYDSPLRLSPDASELIGTGGFGESNDASEDDLFVFSVTSGKVLRQLTHMPKTLPDDSHVSWTPVAWSSDSRRILVNRSFTPAHSVAPSQSDIYVINVTDGHAEHIGSGHAESWHQAGL